MNLFIFLSGSYLAVGLAQFTKATATREIAYDGEKSIEEALKIMFKDASTRKGNFDPKGKPYLAMNRWEAWREKRESIEAKGKRINDLIKKKGSASKVTDLELNAVLGIK